MAHNDGITISAYQFFKDFPNEQTAIRYIEGLRWADGVTCPHCNSSRTSRMKDTPYHQCNDCRQKFTVRTGTVFERSHIPLDKWLYAMYILQTARKGVSSLQLSKELGITQKATWFMLHRLRIACGNMEAVPIEGVAEVDETYIGGKERQQALQQEAQGWTRACWQDGGSWGQGQGNRAGGGKADSLHRQRGPTRVRG